jgi:hypothetical protein
MCNCTSEVWSFGPSRNDGEGIHPTGKSLAQLINRSVQPPLQKYSDFPKTQITFITLAIPSLPEGRFAIVTNAGWDAVDADVPLTNGA